MASLFSLTTISRAFSSSIGAGMDVPESVEIVEAEAAKAARSAQVIVLL